MCFSRCHFFGVNSFYYSFSIFIAAGLQHGVQHAVIAVISNHDVNVSGKKTIFLNSDSEFGL